MTPSLRRKLEALLERREELEHLLADPGVVADNERFRNLSREFSQLEPVALGLAAETQAQRDLASAESMRNDPELRELAEEEIAAANARLAQLDADLMAQLVPREDMGKFLKQCDTAFQEMEAGARSEQCDWGLTEEIRKKGFSTLLPDVQEMRAMASLLTIRIRYELAEGRPDKAARTLQTGFAMSRHVADSPTLISALVGIAINGLMLERLEETIQQPDGPNFYWALTDLPRPFIDLRKPMQGERVMAFTFRFAQGRQRVGRLAGLCDGEDDRVALHRRIAIAQLRRVFDFDRDAGKFLEQVLADEGRVVAGAARR